jgi:hypothetical protein
MESITWRSIPTNKTSMKNICQYCRTKIHNKPLIQDDPSGGQGLSVLIYYDELTAHAWYDSIAGIASQGIKIHFCPMCGRKLV